MREIKFRAWDELRRIWYVQANINGRLAFVNEDTLTSHEWYDSQIKKVQFTGLKDKNGKEIYEGDIIRGLRFGYAETYPDAIANVTFFDGCFIDNFFKELIKYQASICEVIGNIYENPELLSEQRSDSE